VQEIEEAIERLPQRELFALTDWLSHRFEDAWDRQIEEDVNAGRLDKLAEEALAEYQAGKCTPFPPDAGQEDGGQDRHLPRGDCLCW